MRKTLRKYFLVDMLYAFIAASLAVIVPLYLVDLDIDIVSIGLLLSLFPLVFMILRIFFASIADQIGTKTIEVIESLAMIVAILTYAASRTAKGFAVSRFTEGVREASFWATARTDLRNAEKRRNAANSFAYFVGFRQLADAAGRIGAGMMLIYLSFTNSFYALLILAVIMSITIFSINKNPLNGLPTGRVLWKKIFHRRSMKFWYTSLALTAQSLVPGIMLSFLLPLYAYANLGFDYNSSAMMIGLFSFAMASANLFALRMRFKTRSLIAMIFLAVPMLFLLPYSGTNVMIPVFLIGLGAGCGNILTEHLLADEVSRLRNISTEIGITFLPLRISEFLFLSFGGLVILWWGFVPLFYLCALLTLGYGLYALRILNK